MIIITYCSTNLIPYSIIVHIPSDFKCGSINSFPKLSSLKTPSISLFVALLEKNQFFIDLSKSQKY